MGTLTFDTLSTIYSKNKKINKVMDNKNYNGGTSSPIRKRKAGHKRKAKLKINRTVYKHLNEIGRINVKIVLIESYPCNNKDELIKREQYWIDELKPILNFHPAYKSFDKLGEWYREHRQEVHIVRSSRIMCECGTDIRRGDKARHQRCKKHQELIIEIEK